MKEKIGRQAGIGAAFCAWMGAFTLLANAVAGVLYDGDGGRTGGIFNPGVEYGDEVVLSSATPSVANPVSINGAYVVVAPNGYTGGASVTLRIRKLNGPPDPKDPGKRPGPGDVMGSGSASIPVITRTTRIYVGLGATLDSSSFVLTAEFSGLSSTTALGVMVVSGASGGSSSAAELWVNSGGAWKVQDLSPSPSNLGIILLGPAGSEALRAGGGSASSSSTTVTYRENAVAVAVAKGSLVSFAGTQTLTVSVTNPSGDKLTSGSAVSDASGAMTFSGTEGSVRDFLENLQYENTSENPRAGAHVINFAAGSLSSSITVNVTAVNDAPVVALDTAKGAQITYTVNQFKTGETPLIVPFTYFDPEGTSLLTLRPLSDVEAVIKTTDCEIIEASVDAAGNGTGKLKINQANVPTGTAFPAGLRVAIIATDRSNLQGNVVVFVKVNSKNAPPIFTIAGNDSSKIWTVAEDGVLEVGFTLVDDAPEGLTIEKSSSDSKMISAEAIVPKTRTTGVSPYFEIKPQPNQNGLVTLTLVAKDKDGATTTQVLKVSVTSVDDAPVITAGKLDFTGLEFQPKTDTETPGESLIVKIPFDVSDVDLGDTVTLAVDLDEAAKKLLSDVRIIAATKVIQLTPRPFQSGPGKVTLVATDKGGLKAQKEFTLTVPDLNNPPVFAEVTTSKTARELLFKVDDDKPVIAANLRAVSDKLDLIPNDFQFTQRGDLWVMTYTILSSLTGGEVRVKLSYKDEGGLLAEGTISFTVDKLQIPPALEMVAEAQVNEDEQLLLTIGVDDLVTPADKLTVTVTFTGVNQINEALVLPEGIKVENVAGSPKERLITFTPVTGAFGAGEALVTVTAESGLFATKTLSLKFVQVNDAPVVNKGIADQSVDNNVAFEFQVPVDAFKDADLVDTLSYAAELAAGGALPAPLFGFTALGKLTFNAELGIADVKTYDIKVTASDLKGAKTFTIFKLTVKDTGPNLTLDQLALKAVALYELTVGRPAALPSPPLNGLTGSEDVKTALSKGFALGLLGSDASSLVPDSIVSREKASAALARLYAEIQQSEASLKETPFTDLSGIGGASDIARVVGLGLLTGVNPTSFSPASPMKTGAFDAALDKLKPLLPAPNHAPVSTRSIGDQAATVGVPFNLRTADSFADTDAGDRLTLTARLAGGGSLPLWLNFGAGGEFKGKPGTADVASLTIEVVARDRYDAEAVNSFVLKVSPPPNRAPVVSTRIGAQQGRAGTAITFQFGDGAFSDLDAGDTLKYSATLASGDPLPSWLSFDAATRTFSGIPPAAGGLAIRVIATDASGESVFDLVTLTISPKPVNAKPTVSFGAESYKFKEDLVGGGKIQFSVNDAETPVKDLTFAVTITGDLVAGVNYVAFTGEDFLKAVKAATAGATTYELTIAILNDNKITTKDTSTIELKVTDADGGVATAKTKLTVTDVNGTVNERLVNAYYTALLDRQADAAGYAFWGRILNDNTLLPEQVAKQFINSTEGRSRFVSQAYQEILGRDADAGGLSSFVNSLAAGSTRQQILAQFLGSAEFFSNFAKNDNATFVRLLYHHVLGRAADAAGFSFVNGLLTAGQSRTAVATILLTSNEYYSNLIGSTYSTYLRRGADSGGISSFVSQLSAGSSYEAILAQFLGSAEFIAGLGNFTIPGVSSSTTHYPPSTTSKGLVITTLSHPWGRFSRGAFTVPDPISSIFTPSDAVDVSLVNSGGKLVLTYGPNDKATPGATVDIDLSASLSVASSAGGGVQSGTVSVGFSTRGASIGAGVVNPLTISAIGPQVTDEGKAASVSVIVSGAGAGLAVTATSANTTVLPAEGVVVSGSGADWVVTLTPAAGQAEDVDVTVKAADASGKSASQTFKLSILPAAPVITKAPTDQVITRGGTAIFTVEATGSNLRYQWQRFDFSQAQYVDVKKAELSSYSTGISETLRVVVQNLGGKLVTDPVKCVVATPPSARVLPAEGLTIEAGQDATFTVASIVSSFPPVTIDWWRNGELMKTGAGTFELSTDGLTLVVKAPTEGGTYSVRVSDTYSSSDSNGAELVVRKKLAIKTHPAPVEAAIGGSATFTVEMEGVGPFRYQWRKGGVNIPGATDKTLTVTPVKVTDGGRYSVVVVKDDSNAFTSNEAELKLTLPDLSFTDGFASRGTLSGSSGLGDANNATAESATETDEPLIQTQTGTVTRTQVIRNTVWAKWVASDDGVLSLSTEGSWFDTVLSVYTGGTTVSGGTLLANLLKVAEDDEGGASRTSKVSLSVVKGTEYAIRVALAGGEPGVIVFGWDFLATPVPLPSLRQFEVRIPDTRDNLLADVTPVTFTFVAQDVDKYSIQDSKLNTYSSTTPSVTLQIKMRDYIRRSFTFGLENSAGSRVSSETFAFQREEGQLKLVISKELYTRFLTFARLLQADGSTIFRFSNPRLRPAPIVRVTKSGLGGTGQSANALNVTPLKTPRDSFIIGTDGETTDPGEPNHGGVIGGASVWFSYLAPASGTVTATTEGETDFDTVLAVYTGTVNAFGALDYPTLKQVASDNNSGANGLTSRVSFKAEKGVEYFLAVDGVDGASGLLEFTASLDVVPTLSAITDQTVDQNSPGKTVAFKVEDTVAGASGLKVTGSSSDNALIDPSKFVFSGDGVNRTVVISPEPGRSGVAEVTLSVNDGVYVVSSKFKVTVAAVNQPPVADDLNVATSEDSAKAFVLSGKDPEGKPVTYKILTQPALGKITGLAPKLTFAPTPDANGVDRFTYSVNDGALESAPAFITVTVLSLNDAPGIAALADAKAQSGTPLAPIELRLSDVDSSLDSLSVVVRSDNQAVIPDANLGVTGIGGVRLLSLVPSSDTPGRAVVTVTVSDPEGGRGSAQFAVDVVGAPPTFILQPKGTELVEGASYSMFGQAGGTGPFTYSWLKDGQPVPGATTQVLNFDKLKSTDAGKFSLVVKNPVGSATSDVVEVKVRLKSSYPTKLSGAIALEGFALSFTSAPGDYRIQASSDLATWKTILGTTLFEGSIEYTDTEVPSDGMRFYRVIEGQGD